MKSGQTLGLGSGELSSLVIEEVGKRVMNGQLTGIQGVPASNAAASEAAFHGVPLHPDPTDLVSAVRAAAALHTTHNMCKRLRDRSNHTIVCESGQAPDHNH